MKVYLAGPITGLTYDGAQDWRTALTEELDDLGIECYSPLRAQAMLRDHGNLDAGGIASTYTGVHPLLSASGMTTRDRYDVESADLVFANLLGAERASIGTAIELGWADAFGVPTVVAIDACSVHDHALIHGVAGFIVYDLDTALECIKGVLLP